MQSRRSIFLQNEVAWENSFGLVSVMGKRFKPICIAICINSIAY